MTGGVEQPHSDGRYHGHSNHHAEQESGNIRRAKLSDPWHTRDYNPTFHGRPARTNCRAGDPRGNLMHLPKGPCWMDGLNS
jgi:hypothetical protein